MRKHLNQFANETVYSCLYVAFLLPFNIWGQRTSNASSSTTDSLFNDAARQYYVKKLHGEDVRELKASFNGNVTIEFGKRKHQVYNVTVIYSIYKNNEWCATHYKNWYLDLKERKCYWYSDIRVKQKAGEPYRGMLTSAVYLDATNSSFAQNGFKILDLKNNGYIIYNTSISLRSI